MAVSARISKLCARYDTNLTLKPLQRECLEYIWNTGGDVLFNVPTGYGKSLIFHLLPWLLQEKLQLTETPVIVVVSPLNVIQEDQLAKLTEKGMYCKCIHE